MRALRFETWKSFWAQAQRAAICNASNLFWSIHSIELSSTTQSSRHSGSNVDCPRSAPCTKRVIPSPRRFSRGNYSRDGVFTQSGSTAGLSSVQTMPAVPPIPTDYGVIRARRRDRCRTDRLFAPQRNDEEGQIRSLPARVIRRRAVKLSRSMKARGAPIRGCQRAAAPHFSCALVCTLASG